VRLGTQGRTLICLQNLGLTSIPACRKTLRNGKNDRYFDFKNLKNYAHPNISYNLLEFMFYSYYSSTTKLFPSLVYIKGIYPKVQDLYTMREIVLSLMAPVAYKFVQDRHADKYFQSED
jgi:hypothetical protein